MRRVIEFRANRIIYNFIKSNSIQGQAIVPANLCQSVIDTLLFAGMNLIFVDISTETLCADSSSVIKHAENASLFLFVHTYGVDDDCPSWFFNVKKTNPNIAIIDDRCLCFPSFTFNEEYVDLVLFSFGEKKQVNLGGGGLGFISSKWKYERIHIDVPSLFVTQEWGFEKELFIEKSQRTLIHKKQLNHIYEQNLPKGIQMQRKYQQWRFNIIVPQKDLILREIFNAGLFASSHYKSLSSDCLIANHLHEHIINLFNDFNYSEEQAIQTCRIIIEVLKHHDRL